MERMVHGCNILDVMLICYILINDKLIMNFESLKRL